MSVIRVVLSPSGQWSAAPESVAECCSIAASQPPPRSPAAESDLVHPHLRAIRQYALPAPSSGREPPKRLEIALGDGQADPARQPTRTLEPAVIRSRSLRSARNHGTRRCGSSTRARNPQHEGSVHPAVSSAISIDVVRPDVGGYVLTEGTFVDLGEHECFECHSVDLERCRESSSTPGAHHHECARLLPVSARLPLDAGVLLAYDHHPVGPFGQSAGQNPRMEARWAESWTARSL